MSFSPEETPHNRFVSTGGIRSRVTPSCKRQTRIPLTVRRKFLILMMRARMERRSSPTPYIIGSSAWNHRLFANVSAHDNDISYKDIERWVKAYPWITSKNQYIPGMQRFWDETRNQVTKAGTMSRSFPSIPGSPTSRREEIDGNSDSSSNDSDDEEGDNDDSDSSDYKVGDILEVRVGDSYPGPSFPRALPVQPNGDFDMHDGFNLFASAMGPNLVRDEEQPNANDNMNQDIKEEPNIDGMANESVPYFGQPMTRVTFEVVDPFRNFNGDQFLAREESGSDDSDDSGTIVNESFTRPEEIDAQQSPSAVNSILPSSIFNNINAVHTPPAFQASTTTHRTNGLGGGTAFGGSTDIVPPSSRVEQQGPPSGTEQPSRSSMSGGVVVDTSSTSATIVVGTGTSISRPVENKTRPEQRSPVKRLSSWSRVRTGSTPVPYYQMSGYRTSHGRHVCPPPLAPNRIFPGGSYSMPPLLPRSMSESLSFTEPIIPSTSTTWSEYINTTIGDIAPRSELNSTSNQAAATMYQAPLQNGGIISYDGLPSSFNNIPPPFVASHHDFAAQTPSSPSYEDYMRRRSANAKMLALINSGSLTTCPPFVPSVMSIYTAAVNMTGATPPCSAVPPFTALQNPTPSAIPTPSPWFSLPSSSGSTNKIVHNIQGNTTWATQREMRELPYGQEQINHTRSDYSKLLDFTSTNNPQQIRQGEHPTVANGVDSPQLIVDGDGEANQEKFPPFYNPNFPNALPFPPMASRQNGGVDTPQPSPTPRRPGDETLDRFEKIYEALIGLTNICSDFDSMKPAIPNLQHMFKVVERNHARHVITVPYEKAHARKQIQIKNEVVADRGLSYREKDNISNDFAPASPMSEDEVLPPLSPPPQDNVANNPPNSNQSGDKETVDFDDLIEDDV